MPASPRRTEPLSDSRRRGSRALGRTGRDANPATVEGGLVSPRKRLAIGLVLALGAPALAEQKTTTRVVQEPDKVVVRKRTVIDFNDVTVEGELTKPEGSYLLDRNRTRFPSMIRLRDNFDPELQKSADNL